MTTVQSQTKQAQVSLIADNLFKQITKFSNEQKDHAKVNPLNIGNHEQKVYVQTLNEYNSKEHKKISKGKPKVIILNQLSKVVDVLPEERLKSMLYSYVDNLNIEYYFSNGFDPLNITTLMIAQEFYGYDKMRNPMYGDLVVVSKLQFAKTVSNLLEIEQQQKLMKELYKGV